MKACIWDLDGTLFDSYRAIVRALFETLSEQGVVVEKKDIHDFVIAHTVDEYVEKMIAKEHLDSEQFKKRFGELSATNSQNIAPMEHAIETLRRLQERGVRHFVFTNRGKSSYSILEKNQMMDYFDEIITHVDSFPPKPSAEAILYLLSKYEIDRKEACYIGDRVLDMECAQNAGIMGIMFQPEESVAISAGIEDVRIMDLLELETLL